MNEHKNGNDYTLHVNPSLPEIKQKGKNGKAKKPPPATLVGRGMHWMDECDAVQWQGEIIADLGAGYYLVQIFGWLTGYPTTQVIVHLSSLAVTTTSTRNRAVLYDSMESANDYYDHVLSHTQNAKREAGRATNGSKEEIS